MKQCAQCYGCVYADLLEIGHRNLLQNFFGKSVLVLRSSDFLVISYQTICHKQKGCNHSIRLQQACLHSAYALWVYSMNDYLLWHRWSYSITHKFSVWRWESCRESMHWVYYHPPIAKRDITFTISQWQSYSYQYCIEIYSYQFVLFFGVESQSIGCTISHLLQWET